ncbi:hypothetical protein ACN38_g4845 [Penicillium nordicum]|uniref:Uncharacterized protein n=1 Tax=Penicillium nordicum TaxID=229535 RepID=A0A0N0RZ35_9EURO|nr:hypothetical protein ACN38_g4845 [Penicillium nordicum]
MLDKTSAFPDRMGEKVSAYSSGRRHMAERSLGHLKTEGGLFIKLTIHHIPSPSLPPHYLRRFPRSF